MPDLLLAFYGDDFTGSTDSMEALAKAGIQTALFLVPPETRHLTGRFANLRALGMAGSSRSMAPQEMEHELRPKFAHLAQLAPPLVHYKVCSTFDSSPEVGSIGQAIDIGLSVFGSPFAPLVVGAPILRRYVAFANLFATVGDTTYRIDRHPTMSQHPITPMREGDLRRHLAAQTRRAVTSFDLLQLAGDAPQVDANFRKVVAQKPEIVLFDTLDDAHLGHIGRLLWTSAQQAGTERPFFVAGSSGVEYALARHFEEIGLAAGPVTFPSPGPVEQIVVVSGSAAPVTAEQIRWAEANGFATIRLDSMQLITPGAGQEERRQTVSATCAELSAGRSVVLYSASNSDDPAIAATRAAAKGLGLTSAQAGKKLAEAQGTILHAVLQETGLRRACLAGGDTCSYAAPQLGIYALDVLTPLAPGGPLCRAAAEEGSVDGLEIVLKGGQVGQTDFFGAIRAGRI